MESPFAVLVAGLFLCVLVAILLACQSARGH